MKPCHAHNGVTMVELAVGMAITVMLLALAAPSFKNWIQSSQIRTAAEAIQNGLQLARAEAVRRNTQVTFSLGTGSAWTVGCVAASDTCPAAIQSRPAGEGSANAGVDADQTSIVFNGLGRITPMPAGDLNIDITNSTGGACAPSGPMRCLRIVTSTGGQVRMCDPAVTLSSTTPQGC